MRRYILLHICFAFSSFLSKNKEIHRIFFFSRTRPRTHGLKKGKNFSKKDFSLLASFSLQYICFSGSQVNGVIGQRGKEECERKQIYCKWTEHVLIWIFVVLNAKKTHREKSVQAILRFLPSAWNPVGTKKIQERSLSS